VSAVILETFGDLLRHGYRLHGTCRNCGASREIDLTLCPANRSYVGSRFRCRDCGGSAMITLSKIVTSSDAHLPALNRWRKFET